MDKKGSKLARLLEATSVEDTRSAWKDAKRGLLDYFASAGAGAKTGTAQKLLKMISHEGGSPEAPLLFAGGYRGTRAQSALYNGVIGHVLDYDDVHEEVRGHPGTVILPALLALHGEKDDLSRLLAAYVLGVDVMARLGKCMPWHYPVGWHSTATFGAVAAAAACAWYENFSAEETERCMGIAADQAAGLRLQFGSDRKAFHAGYAARTGVEAVQYLKWGLTANGGIMDGDRGFFCLYSGGGIWEEELTRNWGAPWRISVPGLWMKQYPFCSAAAHARDSAVSLRENNCVSPEIIERIELVYPPGGDAALIYSCPENGEEGRFSPEYVAALVFLGRALSFERFSRECRIDEEVKELMQKTVRIHDGSIVPDEAAMPKGRFTIIRLFCRDGRVLSSRTDIPQGSPAKPLTMQELREKLQANVDEKEAERIYRLLSD